MARKAPGKATAAVKKKPAKGAAKPTARTTAATKRAKKPKLLTGGNPQIAKGDGEAPVQDYLAAMPDWRQKVGRRIDALVTATIPAVHKAVKWNSPFYGIAGQGFFMGFHTYTRAVKVMFFKGVDLDPVPPGGTGKESRWIDVHETDLDEAQLTSWIRQAAALPGWGGS